MFDSKALYRFLPGRTAAKSAISAMSVVLLASLVTVLPKAAHAQRLYIGNAYAARVNVQALSAVNIGVNLNDTGNLQPFTQQTLNGLNANILVGTLGSLLGADVDTVQTTSVFPAPVSPNSIVVQSTSSVAGVNILGGVVNSLLGLNITADVIQTQTTAFYSGLTQGSTTLTNLKLGAGFFNLDGSKALIQLDGNGQIVANQTFRVQVLGGLGGLLDVGSLTINEQRINADQSRTTEAIHLRLLDNNVLGSLANAEVIVASSTAGYAPEPGSLALLATGMLPAAALLRRRYKTRTVSPHTN